MDKLTKRLPFSPSALDTRQYTLSLLAACNAQNLLSEARQQTLKAALDAAFLETAAQFTKRDSGSLSETLAEQLYAAVLYRMDAFLLSMPPEQAVEALQTMPPEAMLEQGADRILRLFEETKAIFRKLYPLRYALPVSEYQRTIHEVFDSFCKGYNARFDARFLCASIDYPLLGRSAYAIPLEGVLYMHCYYRSLLLEHMFLRTLPEDDIRACVTAYARHTRCPMAELPCNLTELVLQRVLLNALAGATAPLQPPDYARLSKQLRGKAASMLLPETQAAFSPRMESLSKPVQTYLCAYLPQFSLQLHAALQQEAFSRFGML